MGHEIQFFAFKLKAANVFFFWLLIDKCAYGYEKRTYSIQLFFYFEADALYLPLLLNPPAHANPISLTWLTHPTAAFI